MRAESLLNFLYAVTRQTSSRQMEESCIPTRVNLTTSVTNFNLRSLIEHSQEVWYRCVAGFMPKDAK